MSRAAALLVLGALACDPPRVEPPPSELRIAVYDEEGDLPLTAHVEVRRADGVATHLDLHGEATAMLAPGRYRVTASRGLEWTIDDRVIDVSAHAEVALRLRHVVRSDVLVACDLRTDPSAATADARLLSLASAGFRFAAARERESVADYAAAASRTSLGSVVAFASAVAVHEVTSAPRPPARTYVDIGGWLGGWEQGYSGAPLDPNVVLLSLRNGRSFVTNGPMLEVSVDDAQLGEATVWRSVVHAHVRVRAAPWVDVTSVEIVADGAALQHVDVGAPSAELLAPRLDTTIDLALPPGSRSLVFVVRGDRPFAVGAPSEGARPFAETSPLAIAAGPPPPNAPSRNSDTPPP